VNRTVSVLDGQSLCIWRERVAQPDNIPGPFDTGRERLLFVVVTVNKKVGGFVSQLFQKKVRECGAVGGGDTVRSPILFPAPADRRKDWVGALVPMRIGIRIEESQPTFRRHRWMGNEGFTEK
jgi:hypothetical protein